MGNKLKRQILVHNGALTKEEIQRKLSVTYRPRLVNALDNKYCSKCSYTLVSSAFEKIKAAEDMILQALKEKLLANLF